MTDPANTAEGRSAGAPTYSKDYWDNVLGEIRKRPSIRLAAVLLLFIYAVAIYAPLLANDRPLLLEATDYGAYRKARTLMFPISMSLRRMAREGKVGFDESQVQKLVEPAVSGVTAAIVQAHGDALADAADAVDDVLMVAVEGNIDAAVDAVLDAWVARDLPVRVDGALAAAVREELQRGTQSVADGERRGNPRDEALDESWTAVEEGLERILGQFVTLDVAVVDQLMAGLHGGLEGWVRTGDEQLWTESVGAVRAGFATYAHVDQRKLDSAMASKLDVVREKRRSWAEAVTQEGGAIRLRGDTMRRYLPADQTGPLGDMDALLDSALNALLALGDVGPGQEQAARDEAVGAAGAVVDQAKLIRSEMQAARPPEDDSDSTGEGLTLVSYSSRPALEVITRSEIYFMVLWAFVLLFPLWNKLVNSLLLGGRRHAIRRARRPKVFAVLLLPVIPAMLWTGTAQAFFVSEFKEGLSSGDIVAERVVFTPLPFGLAEQNNSEVFRPPTWHGESEISDEGFYVNGPRAPQEDMAEGTEPVAHEVEVRYGEPERNNSARRLLGTDSLGRDLLARMIWGARISLSVGLVAGAFMVVLGVIMGALAGYFGGWWDIIISRIIEVFQCFPVLFFAMIIVAFLGPGILNIMIVLGLLRWTTIARLTRGEFIRLRDQEFVVASEALGVSHARTIFRHVLPNALGPILVSFTFMVATGILTESTLSYLGFGIQLPVPSWGSLLQESKSAEYWWIQVFPGLVIFLTILLYNLLGEGLRDALDPRQKAR